MKTETSANPFLRLLRAINDLLAKLGHLIGRVVNPVVVSLIYIVVVGPVSLVRRLSGVDPLGLKSPAGYRDAGFRNNTIDACRRQF